MIQNSNEFPFEKRWPEAQSGFSWTSFACGLKPKCLLLPLVSAAPLSRQRRSWRPPAPLGSQLLLSLCELCRCLCVPVHGTASSASFCHLSLLHPIRHRQHAQALSSLLPSQPVRGGSAGSVGAGVGTSNGTELIPLLCLSFFPHSVGFRKQKQRLEPKQQREQQEGSGQREGPQVGGQWQRVWPHCLQRWHQHGAAGEARQPAQPPQPRLCHPQREEPPQPSFLRASGCPTPLQPPQAGLESLRDYERTPWRAPGERTELCSSGADGEPAVLPEGHGQPLWILCRHHVRGSAFRLCFGEGRGGSFWGRVGNAVVVGPLREETCATCLCFCMSRLPGLQWCVAEKPTEQNHAKNPQSKHKTPHQRLGLLNISKSMASPLYPPVFSFSPSCFWLWLAGVYSHLYELW